MIYGITVELRWNSGFPDFRSAFEAQQQAWRDAAELVDDVWDKAFEKANEVRRGFADCSMTHRIGSRSRPTRPSWWSGFCRLFL